jgi:hypothetical protein
MATGTISLRGHVRESVGGTPKPRPPDSWLVRFALFQFACQLALIVPGLGSARIIIRVAAFGGSLALLAFLRGRARATTLQQLAYGVLGILLLEVFHPDGGILASVAQFALYAAIMGPIFWVGRLNITPRTVNTLFLCVWAFYAASAALGVLQAYFPGRFQPALSAVYADLGRDQLQSMQIKLASGEHMLRPMGLTDVPGGAAYASVYAVLLGLGVLQSGKPFFGARVLAVLSMMLGIMGLYLCQVRSAVVVMCVAVVVLIALAAISGQLPRFAIAALVVGVAVPVAFLLAMSVGGNGGADRLATLLDGDAGDVYYKHRGMFLDFTINNLVPRFPLGAGLGRWGMISHYFGSGSESIYVEIQWTGWLLDGGVALMLAYPALIIVSTWRCLRLALDHGGRALSVWPSVIVAYNVGMLAFCFSYSVFIGTAGLEFWLLNAAVMAAAANQSTRAA